MREIVVISGKGGTGKTSLTASFAALARGAVMIDCDVDAPNLAIVLDPRVERSTPFVGGDIAHVDAEVCAGCGQCISHCRFDAIRLTGPGNGMVAATAKIDLHTCEGCAVCHEVCPTKAIRMEPHANGTWFVSDTRFGPMVHARLGIGEDNSGRLVTLVRQEARNIAQEAGRHLLISDGPPGIGCPVIASLSGADYSVLVTEPTVSALHDFERVADLVRHFHRPACLVVNKYDLNPALAERLEQLAEARDIEPLGRIPYDPVVVEAQLALKSVVEFTTDGVSDAIRSIWKRLTAAFPLEPSETT